MSLPENVHFLQDVAEFDAGTAEFIALEVATGATVAELHDAYPERVPNPIIVNRWRRQFPAFGLLMQEAEEALAERIAGETVRIADDEERQAAQANNAIKARQWLASKLHDRYEGRKVAGPGVQITINESPSDEQLLEIARGAIALSSGEYERLEVRNGIRGSEAVAAAGAGGGDALCEARESVRHPAAGSASERRDGGAGDLQREGERVAERD